MESITKHLFHEIMLPCSLNGDFPFTPQKDCEILIAIINAVMAKTVLEIGCNIGATGKLILDNCETVQKYIGVDVDEQYYKDHPPIPAQKSEFNPEVGKLVKGDKRAEIYQFSDGSAVLNSVPFLDNYDIDVVFIDGSHKLDDVSADSYFALAHAKKAIVWHDFENKPVPDVTKFVKLLDKEIGDNKIVHVAGSMIAYLIRT